MKKIIFGIFSFCLLPIILLCQFTLFKISPSTINGKKVNKRQPPPEGYPKEWSELFIYSYENEYEKVMECLTSSPNQINSVDVNNWNALHVAVSNQSNNVITLLLERGIDYTLQNNNGYTSFHIACNNGNTEIVNTMISSDKVPCGTIYSNNLESSIFLAISNNHIDIAILVLEYYHHQNDFVSSGNFKKMIDQFNQHGVTPLIMAVLRKNLQIISKLVTYGADINGFKKDNSTALHCAAISNYVEAIRYLVEYGADCNKVNRYGNTPLHEAAIKGNNESIELLIELKPENADNKDKDGSTPLHLVCNCVNSLNLENNLKSIQTLLHAGKADINSLDSGNATGLHILACIENDKSLPLVKYFLENGANPTIENKYGWTPIHQAHHYKNKLVQHEIELYLKKNYPDYYSVLDLNKQRIFKVKNDDSEQGANGGDNTNNQEILKLNGLSRLQSISNDIKDGKIKNVIVLTGAGISANAGILPYRTKNGLLNKQQKFSFSTEVLQNQPDVFYGALKDHFYPIIKANGNGIDEDGYDNGVHSTPSHHFINSLSNKGVLLRNYTQNVDPLQERTGTPPEKIVHAHGTLDKWYCTVCLKQYENDRIWKEIGRGGLPFCTVSDCRHVIRPDVVFFGEPLSQSFKVNSISDFRKCDLLIIMGTSLIVYPFAGLLNDVSADCPRLLINFESTGPFVNTNDLKRKQYQESTTTETTPSSEVIVESRGNRDIVILGDCDKGVEFFNQILNK